MDFDAVIDRRGTDALKWDLLKRSEGKQDIIPLWVADMDFMVAPAISAALRRRVEHPVFGYTDASPRFFDALLAWYGNRYGFTPDRRTVLLGPGLLPSLGIALRLLSEKGDGVLIPSPVYGPFYNITAVNGRLPLGVALDRDADGRFSLSPDALSAALAAARGQGAAVPLLILCSPHNPGGTVWRRDELRALLDFTRKEGIAVIADEIHGDFVYPPRRFVSLAELCNPEDRVVVLSSANKTFNIAALHLSHCLIPQDELRRKVQAVFSAEGFGHPNALSIAAAEAAYAQGAPWLDGLLGYLGANIAYAVDFINRRVPGLRAFAPEGTYLIWADAAELIRRKGLRDDTELVERLEEEGRVKFTGGRFFGDLGVGKLRVNVACPRAQLREGLERLAAWVSGI